MKDPTPVTPETMDTFCCPRGMNNTCAFLKWSDEKFCCHRGTALEDDLNNIRAEAGLPSLHGNCCGYPLFVPNIIPGPDTYPPIIYIIQIKEIQVKANIPYSDWERLRQYAINRNITVHDFIVDIIAETFKRLNGE